MFTSSDIRGWTPKEVKEWLAGVCRSDSWLLTQVIVNNNIGGKELILMGPNDLEKIGATKVDTQELLLEAIERLRSYNHKGSELTLQVMILRLACQSRSLQRQLGTKLTSNRLESRQPNSKTIILSPHLADGLNTPKQRVSLDTLASVSVIVGTIVQITNILNRKPFSIHDDYRSMKSLLLALSIELTSTAQRDQFVDTPNDIIEKSSKALADYCDRILLATKDPLLVQPFYLEHVTLKKNPSEIDFGLSIRTTLDSAYLIDKISLATTTNKLSEGDEVLQLHQNIIGWHPENVTKLLKTLSRDYTTIPLLVKKPPCD